MATNSTLSATELREMFEKYTHKRDSDIAHRIDQKFDRLLMEMIKHPSLTGALTISAPSAGNIGISSGYGEQSSSRNEPHHLRGMIAMRLRTGDANLPFFTLHPVKVDDSRVSVFVITHGAKQTLILEDDWALFPSDQLVTQLRMLAAQ